MRLLDIKNYIIQGSFNGSIPPNIEEHSRYVGRTRASLFLLTFLFFVIGIIVNVFVCGVMIHSKKRTKTMSNLFIFHLSLTDIIPRIVLTVVYGIVYGKKEGMTSISCKTVMFAQYTIVTVIFGLLTGIAVDRYYHVVHPLRCLVAKDRRPATLVLLWVCATLLSTPFLFTSALHTTTREYNISSGVILNGTISNQSVLRPFVSFEFCQCGVKSTNGTVFFTFYFICAFCIPLITMTTMYTKMLLFLWKRSAQNKMNKVVARSKVKAIRLLLVILTSFVFSWAPLMITELCAVYKIQLLLGSFPLLPLARCISYTSSILNPFIYSIGNANFRCEARKVLCRSVRCKVETINLRN